MAWTPEQLTAIERAIASGTLEVEYDENGHKVKRKFHTLRELLEVRDIIRGELGEQSGRIQTRAAVFRREV